MSVRTLQRAMNRAKIMEKHKQKKLVQKEKAHGSNGVHGAANQAG